MDAFITILIILLFAYVTKQEVFDRMDDERKPDLGKMSDEEFQNYLINNAHKYEQPKSKEQKKYEELKAKQDERNKLNNITLPELTDERFFELTSDTINNHINYHDYLRTEKWETLREKVYERENGICEQCKTNIRLEGVPFCVHHISYENLGNEKDEDIALLCIPCHNKLHTIYPGSEFNYFPLLTKSQMQLFDKQSTNKEYKKIYVSNDMS